MITEEKIAKRIENEMPEAPYGFDTRVDAQVNSLIRGGHRSGFAFNWKMFVAVTLVAVLGLTGLVGGIASVVPVAPSKVISARLDKNANLTEDVWYSHNTVGLAGLPLRDRYTGLTDKWYNVVAVDLTKRGRQTYTLVASNIYYIGECYVDVSADSVTVTYGTYRGNLVKESECVQWFLDPADITTDFLNNPVGSYEFGQRVSIKKELNGAEVALLFICNQVTYRNPYDNQGSSLVRYYANLDEWKAFRADQEMMMVRLDAQIERMKREAEEKARREAEEKARLEAEAAAAVEQAAAATEAPKAE